MYTDAGWPAGWMLPAEGRKQEHVLKVQSYSFLTISMDHYR